MCVIAQDICVGEGVRNHQGAMLPLEKFAFVCFELMLESFPPLLHGLAVALGNLAQITPKTSSCSLAGSLRPTTRNALGNIVSAAHQSNEYHSFSIQTRGPILCLDGVIHVDVGRCFGRLLLWGPVPYCYATSEHHGIHIFAEYCIHDSFPL